ncbi:hypothetical protein EDB84DRAFT_305580 [Lactarius hengduanensis]|nr:hypothetical protein EDB84DRAFT_305580 [Lactarius hengduanensis]
MCSEVTSGKLACIFLLPACLTCDYHLWKVSLALICAIAPFDHLGTSAILVRLVLRGWRSLGKVLSSKDSHYPKTLCTLCIGVFLFFFFDPHLFWGTRPRRRPVPVATTFMKHVRPSVKVAPRREKTK